MILEFCLEEIENAPKSAGRTQLARFLKGEHLTRKQAILAACCICQGYYYDGKEDCEESQSCPLYQYMPYGRQGLRERNKDDQTRDH